MKKQGFTLVYAAALLVVLGMGLYMVTRYFAGVVTQDHYTSYNSAIDRAELELLSFLKRYRHLPRQEQITDNVTGNIAYLLDRWETGLVPYFRPKVGASLGYIAPAGLEICSTVPNSFIPIEPPNNPPYENPYFYALTYSLEQTEGKFLNYRLHYCDGDLVGTGSGVQCANEVFEGGNEIPSVAFMIIHPGENLVFDTAVVKNADGGGDIYSPRNNDDLIRYYNTGEIYSMMGCDYKLNQRPVFERRLTLGRPRGSNTAYYYAYTPDVNAYIGSASGTYNATNNQSGFPAFDQPWLAVNDDDYWNTDYPPFYRTYFLTMEHMRNDRDYSYMSGINSEYSRGGATPCHFQCAWVSVFRIHEYATCIYASGSYAAWRRKSGLSGQQTVTAATVKVPSPANTLSRQGPYSTTGDTTPNCEVATYRDTYHIEFPINRMGQDYDSESCCLAFDNASVAATSNCAIVQGNINGCINHDGTVVSAGSTLQPGDFPYLRIAQSEIPKVKGNRVFITNDVNGEPHHVQGKLISDGIRFNMEFKRGYLAHQIRADTPIVDFVP